MQLFGSYTSPYVRHVRIALLQTQTPCEFIETDAKGAAEKSPTMKVPFLHDGAVELTDSMPIVRYIREQADQSFLPSLHGLEIFCLANTLMDSAINLFALERNGLDTQTNPYFDRQRARIEAGLYHLEKLQLDTQTLDLDAKLRLECFLAWGIFRERFTLDNRPHLQSLLTAANKDPFFAQTRAV
ncbi:MAG TPA: glutathione S-transferase N-terminal domain-containing protein [Marinagarivorans sp.]